MTTDKEDYVPVIDRPVSPGMDIRLNRIFPCGDGRSFVLPIDHGIIFGPLPGLEDVRTLVRSAVDAGTDAILARPGLLRSLRGVALRNVGLIVALTGRLSHGVDHVELNTVEEAVRAGADAVALELKLGSPGEMDNVRTVSLLRERAHQLGLPVLIMVYAMPEYVNRVGPRAHVHACRIGEELGADIIKTGQPDEATLRSCLTAITVPLLVAGGDQGEFADVLARVAVAVTAGAAGAAVGRKAWGHPHQGRAIEQMVAAVHG